MDRGGEACLCVSVSLFLPPSLSLSLSLPARVLVVLADLIQNRCCGYLFCSTVYLEVYLFDLNMLHFFALSLVIPNVPRLAAPALLSWL